MEALRQAALAAAAGRLLLPGASGIGKSVLLAQLRVRLGPRAHCYAMDHAPALRPEPDRPAGPGALAASLAPPVRTDLLAWLCRHAVRPEPRGLVPCDQARALVADCLETIARRDAGVGETAPLWVLIDGLNQAADPNELLDALPEPLPAQLHVVASCQPIAHVLRMAEGRSGPGDPPPRPWARFPAPDLSPTTGQGRAAAPDRPARGDSPGAGDRRGRWCQ